MLKKGYSLLVDGKKLTAEFNDLAEQADGSVMVRYGETVILVTAMMGEVRQSDFFPLTVDYEERYYATGRILGSRYSKREGRPTTPATLSARLVDRTIRPLFDQRLRHEVQIIITTLAIGKEDPEISAVIGASLALGVSDIPWGGPVSAIRMHEEGLDMVACGKDGMINMIEVAGREVSEDAVGSALERASVDMEKIQVWQKGIIKDLGRHKRDVRLAEPAPGTRELFEAEIKPHLSEHIMVGKPGKEKIHALQDRWATLFAEKFPAGDRGLARAVMDEAVSELLHAEAIDKGRRPDGRALDEVRPIYAQAGGVSSILHGSGIFYRGGTHIFTALTLGGPDTREIAEGATDEEGKHFMHHYNFPPFSTGDTGRVGSTNRRMIGHGALAERALVPVIPLQTDFPYTIRLVSEAFSSNGSTSMGSVCASTLALMDGGVPIKAQVAGIACGLMMRDAKTYKVLTDIQGPEDHHGHMDLKVAGTRSGITAMQMDVKVSGIPLHILREALAQARAARLHILDAMAKEISLPRQHISSSAPEIIVVHVKPDHIGLVIGSGGKTIHDIRATTHVEEILVQDDGSIYITGKNGSAEKARDMIHNITKG